jgi:hypothetical protein
VTDCTILTTSSKSGKELVLSLEWINSPSTVTSNEAVKSVNGMKTKSAFMKTMQIRH